LLSLRRSWLPVLCLALSAAASAHASSLPPRQAAACGGSTGLQQCGAGFPSSFCCPQDTTCMALNSTTVQSVICCPSGQDCAFIQTITCDVTQLNATLHPDNQMHLSDTTAVDLPKCNDKCCPLGYTCNSGMCSKDATTPSASPTSTSRPASSASSVTKPAAASQTSKSPPPNLHSPESFDGRSFAAGFIPGIFIGAFTTLAVVWLLKKRRELHSKSPDSGDYGHVARQISDPIYDPSCAARTDFMRRGSSSVHSSPNSTDRIIQGMQETRGNGNGTVHGLTPRIKSMWDRTPKLNFGFPTISTAFPAAPAPVHTQNRNAPLIRAGNSKTDPYATPSQKPKQIHSTPRHKPSSARRTPHNHQQHNQQHTQDQNRLNSTETIDVLMPAPSFLEPPRFPAAMRENRNTSDTTFTKLMDRAGFDEGGQREVREWRTPPVLQGGRL